MKIRKPIAVLAAILYIALIYFSPPRYIDKPKFLLLRAAKSPLTLSNAFFRNISYLARSKSILQENKSLRETVDAMTRQLSQYQETEQENARLRRLLSFKEASSFNLAAASVVAKDSSNFSETIVIDRGRKQKIEPDTVVIAEAGLVGRVRESSPSLSRIVLITDPNSRVSAIVSASRQIGMVYGTSSGVCELRHIPLDSDIAIGCEVVTSGFSDIYPKGILIGKLIKIKREPRGLSLSAVIDPAVDFTTLEEVLCIE